MQITSAESARVALDLGADYLVCQGTEAGGHIQATRGLYEALPLCWRKRGRSPWLLPVGWEMEKESGKHC
jgi:hypothetical protein